MLSYVILLTLPLLACSSDWNYDDSSSEGPSHWIENHPLCGGTSQSPINISTIRLSSSPAIKDVIFSNYDQVPLSFMLTNNGHSVQLANPNNNVFISVGGLGYKYVLEQLHFHWGADDIHGSEHLIDGKGFPLEIHLVHYNSDVYDSVTSAAAATDDPTGVAVLAVFVDIDDTNECIELGELTTNFNNILIEGSAVSAPGFALDKLLPTDRSFYRYNGSLTTPECGQIVVWTVFKQPIKISSEHMALFRQFHGDMDKTIDNNNRPVQPLNGRLVYSH